MPDDFPSHRAPMPTAPGQLGIGVVGAGFIVRDCHLVAYAEAGFRVEGITSRTRAAADEVAALRAIPRVFDSVESLVAYPEVDVLDVAVPPAAQPGVIRSILAGAKKPRGILAQKPLAMSLDEAMEIVSACRSAGVALQVNQNMRHDHSVRALKGLIDRGVMGQPVLATIEMRAIPHWMPWAEGGRSLSTFVMSIHHLDTFRYWLGEPTRVLASTRPDPRTTFEHRDGINLYILEFDDGARAASWDDVWAGPAREGGRARDRHPLAVRGDRRPGARHDRLARLARARPQHDRLDDEARRRRVAPPALARSLVPRRLRRADGRSHGGDRDRSRARHLGARQPQDAGALRGGPPRGARASRDGPPAGVGPSPVG